MARFECSVCGYVYDETKEGNRWEELPDDWKCPICGATKSQFDPVGGGQAQPAAVAAAASRGRLAVPSLPTAFSATSFWQSIVVLLVQMIPRLWSYQIELPARTVLHIALGMAVGVALLLKILIVRFFRRLDQALVPMLGTSILVGSVVLIGVSVPTVFQEALATRKLFAAENRERVKTLLSQTGLNDCGMHAAGVARRTAGRSARVAERVHRVSRLADGIGQATNARQLAADGPSHGGPDHDVESDRRQRAMAGHSLPDRAVTATAAFHAAVARRPATPQRRHAEGGDDGGGGQAGRIEPLRRGGS